MLVALAKYLDFGRHFPHHPQHFCGYYFGGAVKRMRIPIFFFLHRTLSSLNILHVATKSIKMAGSTTYPEFFFLTDTQFSFSRFHNELWGGPVNLFPPKHLRTIFFFNLRMFMGNSNKETQNKSNTIEKGERK